MRLSVTLAMATILLAGCTTTDTPNPTDASLPAHIEPGPDGPGSLANGTVAPASVHLAECAEAVGFFDLTEDQFHAVAPAGFEPADGGPRLVVEARRCTLDGVTFSTMSAGVAVTPTAEFASSTATEHRLLLGGIMTHATVRDLYEAWGLDAVAQPGDAAVVVPAPKPAPGVTHSVASNDNLSLDLYATVSETPENQPEGTIRYLVAPAGSVTGVVDVTFTARDAFTGNGVLQTGGTSGPPQPGQPNGDASEVRNFEQTLTYVGVAPTAA